MSRFYLSSTSVKHGCFFPPCSQQGVISVGTKSRTFESVHNNKWSASADQGEEARREEERRTRAGELLTAEFWSPLCPRDRFAAARSDLTTYGVVRATTGHMVG